MLNSSGVVGPEVVVEDGAAWLELVALPAVAWPVLAMVDGVTVAWPVFARPGGLAVDCPGS